MSHINEEYITDFIREHTSERSELLKELEDYARINHVPIIEPEVVQFLKLMIKIKKPKSILEIGTAIGYSAIVMAEELKGEFHITTLEKSPKMLEQAIKNIDKSNYSSQIEIIEGDALDTLPHLTKQYDLIFLDAAKGKYLEFYDYAKKLLKPEGLIISDNVLYKGMVATDELVVRRKRTIVNRLREYLELINKDKGYASAIIPLGDGVAITYKEESN